VKAGIRVTDSRHLHTIVAEIHDQWFSVDDVVFDPVEGLIQVQYRGPASRRRSWFKKREPAADWTLTIRCASAYRLEESQGVGRYDFNEIEYSEEQGDLIITTGIPLRFSIDVSALDVSVRRDTEASLTEFQIETERQLLTRLDEIRVKPGLRAMSGENEPHVELRIADVAVWIYPDPGASVIGRGVDRMIEKWDYDSPEQLRSDVIDTVVSLFGRESRHTVE
jgi:hypothetical protein